MTFSDGRKQGTVPRSAGLAAEQPVGTEGVIVCQFSKNTKLGLPDSATRQCQSEVTLMSKPTQETGNDGRNFISAGGFFLARRIFADRFGESFPACV